MDIKGKMNKSFMIKESEKLLVLYDGKSLEKIKLDTKEGTERAKEIFPGEDIKITRGLGTNSKILASLHIACNNCLDISNFCNERGQQKKLPLLYIENGIKKNCEQEAERECELILLLYESVKNLPLIENNKYQEKYGEIRLQFLSELNDVNCNKSSGKSHRYLPEMKKIGLV